MASLNVAQLIGNLGKDPVVKTVGSGIKVASFSIATSESWTDKNSGEKKEKTVWHNVVCWRGFAEVVEKYVKKGSQVFVSGSIDNRSYDKPDGTKGYMSEIIVDKLVMLGGKRDGGQQGDGGFGASAGGFGTPSGGDPALDDSQLPF